MATSPEAAGGSNSSSRAAAGDISQGAGEVVRRFRDVLTPLPGVVRIETLIVLSTTEDDAFGPTAPGATA